MTIILLLISISMVLAATKNNIIVGNFFLSFANGQVKLDKNPGNLRQAMLPQAVQISNGTIFHLSIGKVVKDINGSHVVMYGVNGQVPGPIIKVKQGSIIFVNFTNNLDMDSSIHWHGLKLNNKYDGVPGLTQDPVNLVKASYIN